MVLKQSVQTRQPEPVQTWQPEVPAQPVLQPQDIEHQLEQSYAPFVQQIQETEKKFAAAQAENRALHIELTKCKQDAEGRERTIQAMQAAERARIAMPSILTMPAPNGPP